MSRVKNFSGDPRLIPRVREHIANAEEDEEPDEIAFALQQKYTEYARKKRGPFEKMVKEAIERLRLSEVPNSQVSSSRKRKYAPSQAESPRQEVVISSEDDIQMEEVLSQKNDTANKAVRDLYSRKSMNEEGKSVSTPRMTSTTRKKRSSAGRGLGSAAKSSASFETSYSSLTFADIGGCEDQKLDMCRLAMHVIRPKTFSHLKVEPPKGCIVHGPPGCGKTMFAQALAGQFSIPILQIAVTELVSGVSGETEERIRSLFESAKKAAPCVVILDDIDVIAPKKETATREMERRVVSQLCSSLDELFTSTPFQPTLKFGENGDLSIESSNSDQNEVGFHPILVIGTTSRIESVDGGLRRAGRFDCEISLGIPDEAARLEILNAICKLPLDPSMSLSSVAHLTPGYVGADLCALIREAAKSAINRMFDNVVKRTSRRGGLTKEEAKEELNKVVSWLSSEDDASLVEEQGGLIVSIDDFHRALLNVQPSAKREGFATVPDVSWDEIGALKRVRDELEWSILCPVRNPNDFAALGLSNRAQGILLCGPPGILSLFTQRCGKTLVAKAVANESGLNFISVKGPELLNMYVGESERAVRTVFQRARDSSPCVIFFDEIDALCARRTGNESSGSARLVNQFLTEMDGVEGRKQVFIIGATNRPDIVDAAILRPGRLDKIVFVDLPDREDRADIIRKGTKNGTKPKLADDVDIETLAGDPRLERYTGADIIQMIHQAGILALKDRRSGDGHVESIHMRHLDGAIRDTRPSVTPEEQRKYALMKTRFTASQNN